jgi:hypothetical protein
MHWTAPLEKDTAVGTLEKRLWEAANQLWAGAGLKQSEYSVPVLGLIFLRFAEVSFAAIIAPSFRFIQKLRLQIQKLRRMHHLLLPRLLSRHLGRTEQ